MKKKLFYLCCLMLCCSAYAMSNGNTVNGKTTCTNDAGADANAVHVTVAGEEDATAVPVLIHLIRMSM